MGSVRGFRCQRCRAEILATDPERAGQPGWSPPILCCGEPLRPLAADQVQAGLLIGSLLRGRLARCPRCGYRVRLVVHPAGLLTCLICQKEFEVTSRQAGSREETEVAEASGVLQTATDP